MPIEQESNNKNIIDLKTYFSVLSGVQDQIRFADRKAAFISAMNALILGFAIQCFLALKELAISSGNQTAIFWVSGVALALAGLGVCFSVVFVSIAVVGRFGELAPNSRIYFGHIAATYGKDYSRYVKDTMALSDDSWAEEIGTQIVELSHIARTKHRHVSRGLWCSLFAFSSWIMSFIVLALE